MGNNKKVLLSGMFVFFVLALFPISASAIPAFAKRVGDCIACHTGFPYLNSFGRQFKENGFRLKTGKDDYANSNSKKISDSLQLGKTLPLSLGVKLRPVDAKRNTNIKLRALHEIEVLLAGNFWTKGSYFIEVETEDETGFTAIATSGFAGFHLNQFFNFILGYGSIFRSDPYNTITNHRITVNKKAMLSNGFLSNLIYKNPTQFFNMYGRAGLIYYALGLSAGTNNMEGNWPRLGMARVMVDLIPWLSIGAFGVFGRHEEGGKGRFEILRPGIDFNIDYNDLHLLGAVMVARETLINLTQSNWAGFLEFYYTMMLGARPIFVPLLRFDVVQAANGTKTTGTLLANISSYLTSNINVGAEFFYDVITPTNTLAAWRGFLFGRAYW